MNTKTRFVGNCPVCEGDFKLHGGKLVHHGYTRPGVGCIIGDCFAVGMEPFEVSAEGCRSYLVKLDAMREATSADLARLQSGTMTEIFVQVRNYRTRGYDLVKVEKSVSPSKFEDAVAFNIRRTEHQLKELASETERMEKRIAAWTAKPVRTFEEEAAAVQAEKDAKRAEKQAERDAKNAAKIATIQKRLDASMRTKNANNIATIFISLVHDTAPAMKLTVAELMKRVDRDHIWTLFGLSFPATSSRKDTMWEVLRPTLDRMQQWNTKYWPQG